MKPTAIISSAMILTVRTVISRLKDVTSVRVAISSTSQAVVCQSVERMILPFGMISLMGGSAMIMTMSPRLMW